MASTDAQVADLERRLRAHLGRDDIHSDVTPAGELVFHVGELLLSAGENGTWIVTAPGDDRDVVMVLDDNLDVDWIGVLTGGEPDAN